MSKRSTLLLSVEERPAATPSHPGKTPEGQRHHSKIPPAFLVTQFHWIVSKPIQTAGFGRTGTRVCECACARTRTRAVVWGHCDYRCRVSQESLQWEAGPPPGAVPATQQPPTKAKQTSLYKGRPLLCISAPSNFFSRSGGTQVWNNTKDPEILLQVKTKN